MDFQYQCHACGRVYAPKPEVTLCPACADDATDLMPLQGMLDVVSDRAVRADAPLTDFLPVPERFLPPIPVGHTPLWPAPRLRRLLGLPALWLKDETAQPTGSLKDRASYLVAGFAAMHGIRNISLASTGNAGSSMAGVGAAAGLDITLFLPEKAPEAKLVQARQYGARVVRVAGNYDRAYALSDAWFRKVGGLSRNTGFQPMTVEGKKTAALEIWRTLGRVPDHVFVPTGDGVILCGIYKGFADLVRLGFADRVPCIHAVQATGSDALYRMWTDQPFAETGATSVADSIVVDRPAAGLRALAYLRAHDGRCLRVTDTQILDAQHLLARTTGLFVEPAAAAALAGLRVCADTLPHDAVTVLLCTGSGLKDSASAARVPAAATDPIGDLDDLAPHKGDSV